MDFQVAIKIMSYKIILKYGNDSRQKLSGEILIIKYILIV